MQYLSDSPAVEVCDLKKKSGKGTQRNVTNTKRPHDSSDPPSKAVCNYCGSQNPKKQYPAFGKQCRKCNKLNHFAKCCRSSKRKIEAVDSSPKSDLMFVGALEHSNRTELGADECHTTLNIEGHSVKFKVDIGS